MQILTEFSKFGKVENMCICENLCDHLIGNVYVRFSTHEEAEAALAGVNGRFYAGQLVLPEYSPVTDFRESRCRQFDEKVCGRGGYCNFLHLKKIPRQAIVMLHRADDTEERAGRGRRRDAAHFGRDEDRKDRRGRSRDDHRGRDDRDKGRERDYDREYDRGRDRYRDDRRDDRDRRYRDDDRGSRRDDKKDAPMRSASEERRLKIAMWNKEKAEKAAS